MPPAEAQDQEDKQPPTAAPLEEAESPQPDRDGSFQIEVSPDRMRATLTILKQQGKGKALVLNEIGAAIRKGGFKGVDFERVKNDILEFHRDGKRSELTGYLLVEGKAASGSVTTHIEYRTALLNGKEVERLQSAAAASPVDAFAGIRSLRDFPIEAAQKMAFVKRNQTAVYVEQKGSATEGFDVYGTSLGTSQHEPPVRMLENLRKERDAYISKIDGLFEAAEIEGVTYFRVRPHRDGSAVVKLAADRMSATLSLIPHEGTGSPITAEVASKAIASAGVSYGLMDEAIDDAVARAVRGQAVDSVAIAAGTPPKVAGESRLQFLIEVASGKGVTIDQFGRADFRNQDRLTIVQNGQVFARIVLPQITPEDGIDVSGHKIPARNAPPLALEILGNIEERKEEDGTVTLIAKQSGELLYDRQKLEIRNVHQIAGNLDFKSGNVKFPGSVQVRGNVLSGFYVMAGGDIQVTENVEASLLSANGSVFINQGIKGGGKGVVRAKQSIFCTFAEQATLLAVSDIRIKNSCVRCTVKCNGRLLLESDKGTLVGGNVRAQKGVDVMNLGMESGVPTEVSFGQDYLIADQIENEEREVATCKERIVEIESAVSRSEREGSRAALEGLRVEKLKLLKIIEKRSLRLFSLRESFEHDIPAQVRVRGTLFPGVRVESHGRYYEVRTPKKGIVLTFNAEFGRIQEEPLKK